MGAGKEEVEEEEEEEDDDGVLRTNLHKRDEVASFHEMGLPERVLQGVMALGFEKPSFVQSLVTVPMVRGRDTIAHAPPGNGKTAAFSIGVLARVKPARSCVQAIVVSATRDLVLQTAAVMSTMGRYAGVRCGTFVGATSVGDSLRKLRLDRPHVMVGTPGRLAQLVRQGAVDVRAVRSIVFDEADVLVSEKFTEDCGTIVRAAPSDVQMSLFSATMPAEALDMAAKFMRRPAVLLTKGSELARDSVKQYYMAVHVDDHRSWQQRQAGRVAALQHAVEQWRALQKAGACSAGGQVMVFVKACRDADSVAQALADCGIDSVDVVHGRLPRHVQEQVRNAFKRGDLRWLVCTDMLARGIDIAAVSTVINVGLPGCLQDYVHRVGRCGRFQRRGVALSIVMEHDMSTIHSLGERYGARIRPWDSTCALAP